MFLCLQKLKQEKNALLHNCVADSLTLVELKMDLMLEQHDTNQNWGTISVASLGALGHQNVK